MPRNPTTGVFTRVSNSFSDPIINTVIDPVDAIELWEDYDLGLTNSEVIIPVIWTDVASASTVDLGAVASENVRITGTTTITSFGTVASGTIKNVRFAGQLVLTYNATSLILPNNSLNILTAANDTITAISLGSGNWIVVNYQPATVFAKIDRVAAAGAGPYKLAIGNDANTDAPDFAVDLGASQTKTLAKSLLLNDPGDTAEIGFKIADGTASAPTQRAAPYPGFYVYGWPLDNTGAYVASQSPYANVAIYGGRNAQMYFPIIENATQTARGGAAVIGVTKTSTRTPIDRFWITGANASPGFAVFAGRAFEDSGTSYPYDPSGLGLDQSFSPMTGINWMDYTPPGVVSVLAPNLSNGAAISIRNDTDVDEGFDWKYEHSSNELWIYRVVNGVATTLARFGQAAAFVDLGFNSTTAPALRAQAIASQVDRVEVRGGDGGSNNPKIFVDGTSSDIGLQIQNKGTGTIRLTTNGADALRIAGSTASKVNFVTINGSATGNAVAVGAGGTDTNVSISIAGQGTGAVNIEGTGTNDNAAAGIVGEYVSSTVLAGSAVALTTATPKTITSISLTAGDWDVWGLVFTAQNGGPTTTVLIGTINTVDNTLPTIPGGGAYFQLQGISTTGNIGGPVGQTRMSLSSTTTVYLIMQANFTGGTSQNGYGIIAARRVR